MRIVLIITVLFGSMSIANAQDKFYTKAGNIQFDATAAKSPEKIVGFNHAAVCVMDTKTGALQFSIPMSGFEFEKALMQEHFNENYVESKLFPKAEFKGNITNNAVVEYTKDGVYSVKVKGNLAMHGVTREVAAEGEILVKGGKLLAKAAFSVTLMDYNIKIPTVVADKVATQAKITVNCPLEPLRK